MSLQDLIRTVPPPARPRHSTGDWDAVEAKLGLTLPGDYKGMVQHYGAGSFSDFLIVLNPFLPSAYLNLVRGGEEILHSARTVRESSPSLYPMPLYPEPGGIFPWAVTETGDTLFWRTSGEPDAWTVVLRKSGGEGTSAHPLAASAFLAEWMGKRTLERVFARDEYHTVPEPFEARLARLMSHLEARRIKIRYAGLQGFNQCSFRAGPHDVLVVYSDDADFGSRLELHVPKSAKAWTDARLEQIPAVVGSPFRRLGGAVGGFAWEGVFEEDEEDEPAPAGTP